MPTTTRDRVIRVLACAALLTIALAGCTGGNAPTGGSGEQAARPSTDPASMVVDGYPGLYYDASAVSVVTDTPDELRLVGQLSCAAMDAMLSAGQWRVVDRISLPSASGGLGVLAGIVPGLLLQRGPSLAFVALTGERKFCTATVTKVQDQGIALAGKGLPGALAGWAATTECIRIGEDSLTVSLYFDTTAKLGGVVMAPFVEKNGAYQADEASGDLSVQLLRHSSHVLETFGALLANGAKGRGVTISAPEPGDRFAGSATVDPASADRPRGTFTLSGLVDPESGEQVTMTLPFACPAVTVIKSATGPA